MASAVIPGRAEGASLESVTAGGAMDRDRQASSCFLIMDSGLAGARSPGMTVR